MKHRAIWIVRNRCSRLCLCTRCDEIADLHVAQKLPRLQVLAVSVGQLAKRLGEHVVFEKRAVVIPCARQLASGKTHSTPQDCRTVNGIERPLRPADHAGNTLRNVGGNIFWRCALASIRKPLVTRAAKKPVRADAYRFTELRQHIRVRECRLFRAIRLPVRLHFHAKPRVDRALTHAKDFPDLGDAVVSVLSVALALNEGVKLGLKARASTLLRVRSSLLECSIWHPITIVRRELNR